MKLKWISLLVISCSGGGGGGGSDAPSYQSPGTLQIDPVYDENGLSVLTVSDSDLNSSEALQASAPESDQDISGYAEFSSGSLSIEGSGTLMIEQSAAMGDDVVDELGLSQNVEQIGAGMIVQGSENISVVKPLTIAVNVPEDQSSLVQSSEENLVILYRFYDPDTQILKTHMLYGDDIELVDDTIRFESPGFGAFQAAVVDELPSEGVSITNSSQNYLRNSLCTKVADEDGQGKPIVSLKEIPVSYALIKPCGYFINASNQSSYNFGGRCTELDASIEVSGAIEASYTCEGYSWGESRDLSSLSDGNHSITLKMSLDGETLDEKTLVLKKDTTVPQASISSFTQTTDPRGSEWRDGNSLSTDIAYFSIEKKSGPGTFSYTIIDQPVANGTGTGTIGLNVGATETGGYEILFSFMDSYGNEVTAEAQCTIVYSVDPDAIQLIAPQNFNLTYNENYGVSFSFTDRSTDSDASAEGILGYMIVKRVGSAVTWTPSNGTSYNVGALDSNHEMIGTSSFFVSNDTSVTTGQTYYYAIFEVAIGSQYSAASKDSITIAPLSANQVAFLGGFPSKLHLSGDKVFAAKGARGFAIYDVSGANATNPQLLSETLSTSTINNLYTSGNYLFLAESDRLEIYNVSDASSPSLTANYQSSGSAAIYDVDGFDNYLFLAAGTNLITIDTSTISSPSEVDSLSVSGNPINNLVAVKDASGTDYVYAAATDTVYAFDVETKSASSEKSNVSAGSYYITDIDYGLESGQKRVYIAAGATSNGIRKLDVSNASSINFPGSDTYTPGGTTGDSGGVYVTDDNANVVLVNTFTGLWTADMTPARTDNFDGNTYDTYGDAQDLVVNGNYAYVADGRGGLVTVDISTMSAPSLVKRTATLEDPEMFYISGNYAYVADRWTGVHIVDLTTITAPKFTGLYTVESSSANHTNNGYVQDALVVSDSLFIAASAEGVVKIDVSTKSSPTFTAVNRTGFSDAKRLALAGSNIVVIDSSNGIFILDQSLSLQGSSASYTPTSMVYDGTYLYIGRGSSGIAILDISNPSSFDTPVGSLSLSGSNISAVYRSGDLLFASDSSNGNLLVIDVSTPSSPSLIQTVNSGGYSLGSINVNGNLVYVLGSGYIYVFDASDTSDVFLTGKLVLQGQYSRDIKFKDGKALVTDSHSIDGSGLSVHDSL